MRVQGEPKGKIILSFEPLQKLLFSSIVATSMGLAHLRSIFRPVDCRPPRTNAQWPCLV